MGLYDRDYYREEQSPSGFQLNQRMMVTNIVIVTVAIYFLNMFLGRDNWLMNSLAVDSSVLAKPWLWWKFVTYGLAHDPDTRNLGHIFWNMFGLWIFGRDVEMIYGRKEFLRIYLVALVLGSLVWCFKVYFLSDAEILRSLWGASGAVTAIVLLFVFHYPKRTILLMLVLPVPAWVLGVIMIGGDLFQITSGKIHNVAYDVHLVGAAFAVCYFRFGWNCSRLLPDFGGARGVFSRLKPRPKLRIHDPEEYHRQKDEEADRVLEKVNSEGMDSLTSKEKRILEDYSRRMREKRR